MCGSLCSLHVRVAICPFIRFVVNVQPVSIYTVKWRNMLEMAGNKTITVPTQNIWFFFTGYDTVWASVCGRQHSTYAIVWPQSLDLARLWMRMPRIISSCSIFSSSEMGKRFICNRTIHIYLTYYTTHGIAQFHVVACMSQ